MKRNSETINYRCSPVHRKLLQQITAHYDVGISALFRIWVWREAKSLGLLNRLSETEILMEL